MSKDGDVRHNSHTGDHQKAMTTVSLSLVSDRAMSGGMRTDCLCALGKPSQTSGLSLLFGKTKAIISASQGSCEAY